MEVMDSPWIPGLTCLSRSLLTEVNCLRRECINAACSGLLPLTDTLTVEKPEVPPSVKKKKNREKTKNGEMPSWMLKFAQDNKLNVLSDVKFDESAKEAPPSPSSDEEL